MYISLIEIKLIHAYIELNFCRNLKFSNPYLFATVAELNEFELRRWTSNHRFKLRADLNTD